MRLRFAKCFYDTFLIIFFVTIYSYTNAQTHPPIPFTVYASPSQGLFFGAIFTGVSGGTVIIYPDGTRAVTGDVIQASLGFPFSPAIFEIEAQLGARIAILNGPDVILTGSNGGTMTLHLGASDPISPFVSSVSPPTRTQVRIGGTLIVGNNSITPVGAYSGTFNVTFIQE